MRAFQRENEKGSQENKAVCVKDGGEGKGESKDQNGTKCFPFGCWVADGIVNREEHIWIHLKS